MPDEIKQGAADIQEPTVKTEPAKQDDINIEELRAELETLRKANELSKADLSGKDKKLTELQKELKARMTEEERIKAESQSILQELLDEFVGVAASSIGLDDKHKGLIKGSTKDEIKASTELLKSYTQNLTKGYEEKIKTLEEELKIIKANGTPPVAGSQPSPMDLQSQYEALKKSGDMAGMVAILRAAKREGVEIKQ